MLPCYVYSAVALAFSMFRRVIYSRMVSDLLRHQVITMRQSFFDEEHLDNQFVEMEDLEDDDEPNFLEEVITMFFKDAAKVFAIVEPALEKPDIDFLMMDKVLHQYKGSTSSIGACKLLMECNQTREYLKAREVDKAKATLRQLKEDHVYLQKKFETYFQLMREAMPAETDEQQQQQQQPK